MPGRMIVAGLGLVLLSACGSETAAPSGNSTAPVTTIRNEYHERMSALDELQRGAALRRAIRSSGESCDRVEASIFQQDHENLKMWVARCQSTNYAVFLAATGDVQVRSCADAVTLKLPACRDFPATASDEAKS